MCVCKTRFKNTQSSKSTFLSDFVAVFQKGGGRKKGANYFSSWFSIKFKNSYKITFGLSFFILRLVLVLRLFENLINPKKRRKCLNNFRSKEYTYY